MPTFLETYEALYQSLFQPPRQYTRVFVRSFRWPGDERGEVDTGNFARIVRAQEGTGDVFLMPMNDIEPRPFVLQELKAIAATAGANPVSGRSLCLIHYSGYSSRHNDEVILYPENGWRFIVASTFCNDAIEALNTVDAVDLVFIFDTCFDMPQFYYLTQARHAVEVFAAASIRQFCSVSPSDPQRHRASFTENFAYAIMGKLNRGERYFEPSETLETMIFDLRYYSTEDFAQPLHRMVHGADCLRILFPPSTQERLPPEPPPLQVVFLCHVTQLILRDDMIRFIGWMGALPPDVKLHLDAAYQTSATSMTLVFRSNWRVFVRLSAHLHSTHLVCKAKHPEIVEMLVVVPPAADYNRPF